MKFPYTVGEWYACCQVCGKKLLSSKIEKRWDGLYTCKEDWEPRHPLDFVRSVRETSNKLPFVAPRPAEVDVSPTYLADPNNVKPTGTFGNYS